MDGLGGFEKADAEEIETRPAIHLPFDQLKTIDVPLGRAVAPTGCQSVRDRLPITSQSLSKTLDLAWRSGNCTGGPFVEIDGDLASQGGRELPDQFDSATPSRVKTRELFDQLLLLAVPPVRALQHEPRQLVGRTSEGTVDWPRRFVARTHNRRSVSGPSLHSCLPAT